MIESSFNLANLSFSLSRFAFRFVLGLGLTLESILEVFSHFLNLKFFTVNELNCLFLELFLMFSRRYFSPNIIELLSLNLLIFFIFEFLNNFFVSLSNLSRFLEDLIYWFRLTIDKLSNIFEQLLQCCFICCDGFFQLLRRFSFNN